MTEISTTVRRVTVIDESMVNTQPESCNLYIQLTDSSLSYSIVDRNRNKCIALCEFRLNALSADEAETVIMQDDLLNSNYYKVIVSVYSRASALYPSSFFNPDDAEKLLSLTSPVDADSVIYADRLRYIDCIHIYSLPRELSEVINRHYPGAGIVHSGTVFIEAELLRNKHNTEPVMAINVRQNNYDIVVSRAGSLLFYNSFQYQTSEDFIYYILFVMDQLKLNPDKTIVQLTGEIDKQLSTWLIASKYIRHVVFGNRPEAFEYSYGFENITRHHHYTLLNQFLCV